MTVTLCAPLLTRARTLTPTQPQLYQQTNSSLQILLTRSITEGQCPLTPAQVHLHGNRFKLTPNQHKRFSWRLRDFVPEYTVLSANELPGCIKEQQPCHIHRVGTMVSNAALQSAARDSQWEEKSHQLNRCLCRLLKSCQLCTETLRGKGIKFLCSRERSQRMYVFMSFVCQIHSSTSCGTVQAPRPLGSRCVCLVWLTWALRWGSADLILEPNCWSSLQVVSHAMSRTAGIRRTSRNQAGSPPTKPPSTIRHTRRSLIKVEEHWISCCLLPAAVKDNGV